MTNLAVDTSQIKVTLPGELYAYLKSKSDRYGLTLAAYVRNLVINDVKDVAIPVFRMSQKRERVALQALRSYQKKQTNEITNINKYLNNL
ncbi:hypothetical protein A2630_02705 [Candidatus Woesebacteria bacterium RIFCSPHIGHO2_01_FULL_44_10]|uniref:Uncharacterized protein n=1 Tax=Candidatus Woesebacteria bacterium RIFCSPLOWO2_01_FULL_44_14 TaxID=1802525 RepID=A0A1F8C3S8_9BACT|nr:MAG: hypothetical protein A2630_02705 [Candidatus Woesebacteria bacterium RIFCSPHIGHO2_01_FULL_44_10]OGM56150.1 MAG: hypothetical protein A3F62_00775 [Candidatus Woesebacteria bacterium RIFCSPHIGHO2_12_FULL_44_11]OGM70953.1 MAG: hypothetical protein A2975_01620 [Candidatus Woesebacteria bacterium RIFCSPLOWO2_01_FULL_44_14]